MSNDPLSQVHLGVCPNAFWFFFFLSFLGGRGKIDCVSSWRLKPGTVKQPRLRPQREVGNETDNARATQWRFRAKGSVGIFLRTKKASGLLLFSSPSCSLSLRQGQARCASCAKGPFLGPEGSCLGREKTLQGRQSHMFCRLRSQIGGPSLVITCSCSPPGVKSLNNFLTSLAPVQRLEYLCLRQAQSPFVRTPSKNLVGDPNLDQTQVCSPLQPPDRVGQDPQTTNSGPSFFKGSSLCHPANCSGFSCSSPLGQFLSWCPLWEPCFR